MIIDKKRLEEMAFRELDSLGRNLPGPTTPRRQRLMSLVSEVGDERVSEL